MKIFLDIDGVMVPAKGWLKQEILEDGFPPFSKKAVQALQMLLTPQAEVILTTSHRFNFTVALAFGSGEAIPAPKIPATYCP